MMSEDEDGTSDIGVEHFKSGVDDFDEWVVLFESAVNLATMATTVAEKQTAYWEWLPLRMDKPARAMHAQAKNQVQAQAQAQNPPRDATWPELRTALEALLIDPLEGHKWHAKLMTIKWDGIESLHVFASRVITAVNKFDKNMDNSYKQREYFLRFRMGLPKEPYQDAIDLKVGFEGGSIEKAKKIALRAQLTVSNKGENQYGQVSFASGSVPPRYENISPPDQYDPTPAHAHASDHALSHSGAGPWTLNIEASLASINTRLEDLHLGMRSHNSRLGALERDMDEIKRGVDSSQWNNPYLWPPQSHYPPPYPHWPSQQCHPNVPHSQNPPYVPQSDPPYEYRVDHNECGRKEQENRYAIDCEEGASGYEVDSDEEVAHLNRALEEAKAKAWARKGGNH